MNINQKENKELGEVKALLKENEELFDSMQKKIGEDVKEKDNAEAKIKELELEIRKEANNSQLKKKEISLNKLRIQELEQEIDKNIFDYKVKELLKKQPNVWKVLTERIEHHQKQLDEGLEGLSKPPNPKDVCDNLKQIISGHNFTTQATTIRSVEGEYNKLIKELCECVVRGQKVSVQQKKRKIDLLDRFLMSNEIIRLWGE